MILITSKLDCPSNLFPLHLRSGALYRSLTHHIFTVYEKQWICNYFESLGLSKRRQRSALQVFCSQYQLPIDGVEEWMEMHRMNQSFLPSKCISIYTQCCIDSLGIDAIQNYITHSMTDDSVNGDNVWCELVASEIDKTSDRRDHAIKNQKITMKSSFARKL